jgi:mannosyltransferase
LPFFAEKYDVFLFGYGATGKHISTFKLLRVLFSKQAVVVHCHRNNEMIRFLFLRFMGAKFKFIVTRHAETTPSGLTMKLLKSADQVVTLIESMSKNLGVENTIVGHGVDVAMFCPKEKSRLTNISQEHVILCAGRVRQAKGQIVLLEAAKVLQAHREWALVIVGKIDKPIFLKELQSIAKKHRIEKQVYFIDETADIISYYQACNLVVVPSFSEGFSLVTAEAMSCACNIIATKNVGVHDAIIKHKETGYLVEAGNISELELLLSRLIKNEIPCLGKHARNEVLENWSAQKEAQNLIKVYRS